jgi:hypothetical protein
MRKFLSMVLVTAVTAAGVPLGAQVPNGDSISVIGTAYTVNLQPLPKVNVQIRNLKTGAPVNSMMSGSAGEFAFRDLQPGSYIVEIVDPTGKVLGMTAPFSLGSAPMVNVSVVSVSSGLASSGRTAGFSLFGLGPVSSLAVLGAASAAGVTAVVTTRPNASPSR